MKRTPGIFIFFGLILTLTACGGSSQGSTQTISISTASLPDGVQNISYSQSVQATGGTAPFSWKISSGALPHNLSLLASNTSSVAITGAPDMAQSAVAFTIQVTDSAQHTASHDYTINIEAPNPPQFLAVAPTSGVVDVSYSYTFTATGGVPPYTWTGDAPGGLNLSSAGILSGTPTTAGSFNFLVSVTDSLGQIASTNYGMDVFPAGTTNVSFGLDLNAVGDGLQVAHRALLRLCCGARTINIVTR